MKFMNKKELQSLPVLKATPKMLKTVQQNPLQKETINYGGWKSTHEFYEYGLFIRCAIHKDILAVALYLPEHLCTEGKMPSYTVFISRSERTFITYEYATRKWRTATLRHLDLGRHFYYSKKKWISPSDYQKIQTYLGEKEGGYEGIRHFQEQIREEELERRHKKETAAWDADMSRVPALPKGWTQWVSKVGIPENYIFYRYRKGGAKTGYCTYCEKEVPICKPKYNKTGRCPRCRHEVTYKTINKAGRVSTKIVTMYLIQRCKGGFVTRMFEGQRVYLPGEYQHPRLTWWEIGRTIYEPDSAAPRPFYWGTYKQRERRWIGGSVRQASPYWAYLYRSFVGRVYGRTLPPLSRRELAATGLREYFQRNASFDVDKFLAALRRSPRIEQLVKVGLFCLADAHIDGDIRANIFKNPWQTSLIKALGITRQQLKRLRLENGGEDLLCWMQYEAESGKELPDNVVEWFVGKKILPSNLNFIYPKMSMIQIYNYVRRQMEIHAMDCQSVLRTWADYLSMARGLRMDTNDPIVYRVNKLRQRHADLVRRSNDKNPLAEIGKVLEKYPHVDEVCSSLAEKYEYAGDTYTIVAPKKIDDIFSESHALNHCVSHSEYYWDRMERRESYILFLRRTAEPDKPYYTLEVEPNGTVRQKRTNFDRQNAKDMEQILPFLRDWQKVVAERMSKEDLAMADASRILRTQNLTMLRKQKAKIRTGDFQGQLLADVLLADLLDNPYVDDKLPKAA